ncbi:hypothetical protein GQR58_026902 [Nymphon striatum]|nr:hypothetical protein GQR58_026902 [Nymphon striatum]
MFDHRVMNNLAFIQKVALCWSCVVDSPPSGRQVNLHISDSKLTIGPIKKIESSGTIWSRLGRWEQIILGETAPLYTNADYLSNGNSILSHPIDVSEPSQLALLYLVQYCCGPPFHNDGQNILLRVLEKCGDGMNRVKAEQIKNFVLAASSNHIESSDDSLMFSVTQQVFSCGIIHTMLAVNKMMPCIHNNCFQPISDCMRWNGGGRRAIETSVRLLLYLSTSKIVCFFYEKLPTLVFMFHNSQKLIPESFKEYTKSYIWDTYLLRKPMDYYAYIFTQHLLILMYVEITPMIVEAALRITLSRLQMYIYDIIMERDREYIRSFLGVPDKEKQCLFTGRMYHRIHDGERCACILAVIRTVSVNFRGNSPNMVYIMRTHCC